MADRFMVNATEYMYGDGWNDVVSEIKRGQSKLPQTVGKIAARIVIEEQNFADIADSPIPSTILLPLGIQVIEELYEIAHREGVYEPVSEEAEQQAMGEASLWAIEYWESEQGPKGKIDQDERLKLSQELQSGAYDNVPLREESYG